MAQQGNNGTSLTKDVIYGALGGIAGTIALERVTTWMYRFEDQDKKKLEERIRPEAPFTTLARRIVVSLTGEPPSDNALSALSMGVHWGYGIAWGALYGALHDRVPVLSKAAGLPFGVLFWLVGDEVMTTAMKLTPPPQAFPMDAHLRGPVGHVTYTAVADSTFHALRGVAG